jgi:hypothetical protein
VKAVASLLDDDYDDHYQMQKNLSKETAAHFSLAKPDLNG